MKILSLVDVETSRPPRKKDTKHKEKPDHPPKATESGKPLLGEQSPRPTETQKSVPEEIAKPIDTILLIDQDGTLAGTAAACLSHAASQQGLLNQFQFLPLSTTIGQATNLERFPSFFIRSYTHEPPPQIHPVTEKLVQDARLVIPMLWSTKRWLIRTFQPNILPPEKVNCYSRFFKEAAGQFVAGNLETGEDRDIDFLYDILHSASVVLRCITQEKENPSAKT